MTGQDAGQDGGQHQDGDAARPTGQDAPADGVTVAEAARQLGLSPAAVRKRIRRGSLPALKVGDVWYVVLSEVDTPQDAGQDAAHPTGQDAATGRVGATGYDAGYDAGRAAGVDAGREGEIRRLEEHVATLQAELDVRRRETERLHTLLMQAQQLALPAPRDTEAEPERPTDVAPAEAPQQRPWWKFW